MISYNFGMLLMNGIPEPPFRIMSVDPGVETGLALMLAGTSELVLEDTRITRYAPLRGISPLADLKEWSGAHRDFPVVLVYEDFHVRPGRMIPDTTPLRVIGGIEEWIRSSSPCEEIIRREPVQGKFTVTDDVLKGMGMLGRGGLTRHVNDAVRHTVAWLVSISYLPACKAAWPS
jgi:hypothetical protein